jgi:hypothetical protein
VINGDIIEIVSRGTVSNQVMLNVYHLRATDVIVPGGDDVFKPEVLTELLNLNREWLIEDMQPWATTQTVWHGIDVRNLFNPAELASADYPTALTGWNVGEIPSSFVNPVIYSTRKLYGMHGGRKALSPVSEAVSGNNVIQGGLVASLGVMVGKWNAGWTVEAVGGVSMELKSVVVKRIPVPTGKPKRPFDYRLPTNQGEAVYYIANNWAAKTFLGSQNSRKAGRGS